MAELAQPAVYLLDYGAGNVRSVVNAVAALGFQLNYITSIEDFANADKLIFPGVGSFGACMAKLEALGCVKQNCRHISKASDVKREDEEEDRRERETGFSSLAL